MTTEQEVSLAWWFCIEHHLSFSMGRITPDSDTFFAEIKQERPNSWTVRCESQDLSSAVIGAFQMGKRRLFE